MILFIGQFCEVETSAQTLPQPDPIDGQAWGTVSIGPFTIKYCDFSPKRNRTLNNERIFSGISGNPLLQPCTDGINTDLRLISRNISSEKLDLLIAATGVFCGFHLSKDKLQLKLKLFTDYLGLRKIFICESDRRITFSNAQWLIEKTIPKHSEFDEQALLEIGILGHALENRTRYKCVRLLSPGQVLTIDQHGNSALHQYHDITSIKPSNLNEAEALEALHATWLQVVEDRIEDDPPLSFLSGGMDSRLLVHSLKALGTQPHTANFAPPQTMDRVFAEMAASCMDVPLWLHPTGELNSNVIQDTVRAWSQSLRGTTNFSSHRTIWSGDGGSVGMGHVYLDGEISALCEANRFSDAAARFCKINKRTAVEKAYTTKNTQEIFESAIGKLLAKYGEQNNGRAGYFFLMLNDQRRHLDRHYESVHTRLFDFTLPFFDRRLIELVAGLPTDFFDNHQIYDQLYKKIGGSINKTPWQTYPGHVKCPLPMPKDLEYQWGGAFYSSRSLKQKARSRSWKALKLAVRKDANFGFYNLPYILGASSLTLLGISDRSYVYSCISPIETTTQ